MKNNLIYENKNLNKNTKFIGGTIMNEVKYVIHDGVRMTYEEWLEMKKSEQN